MSDTLLHLGGMLFTLIVISATWPPPSTFAIYQCDRTPDHVLKPRNQHDRNKYVLTVSANPDRYVPLEVYTVTVGLNTLSPIGGFFKEFILVAEPYHYNEDGKFTSSTPVSTYTSAGYFHLIDNTLTTFSDRCPNTVVHSNSMPKREVRVLWQAPPARSGCVALRATVLESRSNWFSDDMALTKILCEEVSGNEDIQPPVLKHCCACSEAKYEMAFEGMWTRNTHPKDFPANWFITKLGELVGSSHRLRHAFWNYNHLASEGVRVLAESGDTRTIEAELKEQSDSIRTIIKSRELSYPNLTGFSYTVFRADPRHHLVSVMSKITPSPDWILGVSNFELCLKNCSWADIRTLNLYPWDVGTDNGITYNAPDEPSIPRQTIRRLTSSSPNDPRSPFYDPDGADMKPLARLHIKLEKVYDSKQCDSYPQSNEYIDEMDGTTQDCLTTTWSQWSACSRTCLQFRQRNYLTLEMSRDCNVALVEERPCFECPAPASTAMCELNDWSQWSSCSATCGKGTRTRDRSFVRPENTHFCRKAASIMLQENEVCESGGEFCFNTENDCPPEVQWGEWSACNATCGTGYKIRFRAPAGAADRKGTNHNFQHGAEVDAFDSGNGSEFVEMDETQDEADNAAAAEEEEDVVQDNSGDLCSKLSEIVQCYQPPCENSLNSGLQLMGGFNSSDHTMGAHPGPQVIREEPFGAVIDCKMSRWSEWTACNVTQNVREPIEPCTLGYKFRERYIRVHAQNGGTPCPKKLIKRKRCKVACDNERSDRKHQRGSNTSTQCKMSGWSAWSPCSTSCGGSAVQQRTRIVLAPAKDGSTADCGPRTQERRCPLPLSCDPH